MSTKLASKKIITVLRVVLFASVIVLINGCKKESGTFSVLLTDSPGTYQEVNVEILNVQVHIDATQNKEEGWYDLNTNSGIYDLLTLQNVTTTLATDEKLPVGDLTEIRLILGTNNSLKDSTGQIYSMTVPSGTQTGIKITGKALKKNTGGTITLDFDANQSVVHSGTKYLLKPVLKVL